MKAIPKQYEYYKMKRTQSEFLLTFETLRDMARFAEKNNIKSILIFPETETSPELFGFSNKGGLMQHPTMGFQTIEDFIFSEQNNFPDAPTYYDASHLGFQKYNEYKMSRETGITDSKAYEDLKKAGYIGSFIEFDNLRNENSELAQLEEIINANELFNWVTKKKFEDVAEFMDAWSKGFDSVFEYREAKLKAFNDYEDYKAGEMNGFANGADFYAAAEKGIDNLKEYKMYIEMQGLDMPGLTIDEKILVIIISGLEGSKKTAVNNLFELLEEKKKAVKGENAELPIWFVTSLNNVKDIIQFLTTNENIKKYGLYDVDGQFFEKKKTNKRSVILDGSNVAHGKTGIASGKPLMKNILTMVNFLIEKGFEDITVFADPTLKRKATDISLLPEIKKLCKYQEAPQDKQADMYLLTHVKQNLCLIISNDYFREWRILDPWIAANIDTYKISFMIEEDKVNIPEFE